MAFILIPALSYSPARSSTIAAEDLTCVFGMGTGVAPLLWAPGISQFLQGGTGRCCKAARCSSLAPCPDFAAGPANIISGFRICAVYRFSVRIARRFSKPVSLCHPAFSFSLVARLLNVSDSFRIRYFSRPGRGAIMVKPVARLVLVS